MTQLNKCPCGKIPNFLLISDNGAKWAYVYGDCCAEWHVEFRTLYNPTDSNECMELAIEAWNQATRSPLEEKLQVLLEEMDEHRVRYNHSAT